MGVSYSMSSCALWPLVSLVVPENQLGTAYGFMQSIQNLGLAVISQVAGKIGDQKGYLVLEVFFCAWLCVALIASILLYLVDSSKRTGLNLSTLERKKLAAQSRVTLVSSEEEEIRKRDYGVSPITPRSAAQLRLRFLSRVGQQYFQLPETYRASALAYPHVLK